MFFKSAEQIRYEQSLKRLKQAERQSMADLFLSGCFGNPHITDSNGDWMPMEDVYLSLLIGDTTGLKCKKNIE